MERQELLSIVEGILFTMGDSVDPDKIATALEIEKSDVISLLDELAERYEKENRGIRITKLDGSYQMCTPPSIYEYLIKIAKQPKRYSLTDTLLETLSIIAYKQPVTKAEIEKIRGVSCDHAVNNSENRYDTENDDRHHRGISDNDIGWVVPVFTIDKHCFALVCEAYNETDN